MTGPFRASDGIANPRPPKRARTTERGDDGYRPGCVVEIEVHNFMTYTHLTAKPGPRLNLVVGPNGTGKSSIVCAIGLGLGGEPQLLGRSSQIGDFVRRGEENGWIKISLRGEARDVTLVIQRYITKRGNKSEWILNDRQATKRDVVEVVQQFNVQLGNLTQFLPQDRVTEFAKLTPIQLLEETEKAVGNPELPKQHKDLIQKSEEMKKLEIALNVNKESLEFVKSTNAELEQDKDRMQQRTLLLQQAATMKKKIPWLKWEEKKVTYEGAKEAEKNAHQEWQNKDQICDRLKATFEPLRLQRDNAKRQSERLKSTKVQIEQELSTVTTKEQSLGAKVRTKLSEIQDVHRKEAMRQERLVKAQDDITAAEEELRNIPPSNSQQELMRELRGKIEDYREKEYRERSKIHEKEALLTRLGKDGDQCHRRLEEINSVNTRLLQALQRAGVHQIGNAYEWVQSHRHEFKKEVYGPVLLEVQVPNKNYATFVENHVSFNIWKSFVTQDVDDRDLLNRNLSQFGVPVINQRQQQPRSPLAVTSAMRQLGIVARLDEVVEAPPIVKMVLIGQSNLDDAFIGTSETNRRADQAHRLGVMSLWTPENRYMWQRSRYGSHTSASVDSVRQGRLFSENVDLREKNELEQRKALLEDEMNVVKDSLKEIARKRRELAEESSTIETQRDRIVERLKSEKKRGDELKFLIERQQRKLQSITTEEGSEDAERRLREDIKLISSQRVQNLINLKDQLTKLTTIHEDYAACYLNAVELDAKIKEMDNNVRREEQQVFEAKRILSKCSQVTEMCNVEVGRAKTYAQQVAHMTAKLQEEFDEIPNSVEELEDAIVEKNGQAAAVICNNENAIMLYEQRCEEIKQLTLNVEEKKSALDKCVTDIEAIKDCWLPKLRDLVANINNTFGQNFREMAVAGEVSLDEHGTDFDKYGILIKVKFRESGSLQVLSAHHQSGGERSVATIVYLVSLQDLTYCPFRVVDEINQGMDPRNERKMFQQLVRAASQPSTPQCLLLTPKLLSDLEYGEECTILAVMNGPWVNEAARRRRDGLPWSQTPQLIQSQ